MAACKLGSKGKSLADSSYDTEVKNILTFLQMQHPASAPVISPESFEITPQDYVAPKFLKKMKSKVSPTSTLCNKLTNYSLCVYLFFLHCFPSPMKQMSCEVTKDTTCVIYALFNVDFRLPEWILASDLF